MERIRFSFRSRAAGHSVALRQAMAAGDHESLRAIAHKLCGTAGTLGFSELSDSAMQLEDLLDRDPAEDAVRASLDVLTGFLDAEAALVRTDP